MIEKLKDIEILEYLMTSEFDEGLTPDESKFLLLKFRNFYRLLSSNSQKIKENLEFVESKHKEVVLDKDKQISLLHIQIAGLQDKFDLLNGSIKKRKLSVKERISGKISIENGN